MPNRLTRILPRSRSVCATSAFFNNDFDGIQPTFKHTPPSHCLSTIATFCFSCAARIAATYPAGPAPLSLYDSAFSVGAIDQFGNVADFSSRGPVSADGSDRIKPDIVAPGVSILSSLPGGNYGENSGTSMAGPHVVGAVALLWSADPTLIGDIDRTEQLLIDTAKPYTGSTSVGCFEGDIPNAAYGYGVVDVYEAVKAALGR